MLQSNALICSCTVAFAIEKSEGARAAIVVNSWFNSLQLPAAPTTPAPAAEVKSAAGTLSDQRTLVSSRSLLTEQLARLCAPECPLVQVRAYVRTPHFSNTGVLYSYSVLEHTFTLCNTFMYPCSRCT